MAAATNISDVVFLLIQQKKQSAQKPVHCGVYETLDRLESSKNLLAMQDTSRARRTQSVHITCGSVIRSDLTDYKGDEFIPFGERANQAG